MSFEWVMCRCGDKVYSACVVLVGWWVGVGVLLGCRSLILLSPSLISGCGVLVGWGGSIFRWQESHTPLAITASTELPPNEATAAISQPD